MISKSDLVPTFTNLKFQRRERKIKYELCKKHCVYMGMSMEQPNQSCKLCPGGNSRIYSNEDRHRVRGWNDVQSKGSSITWHILKEVQVKHG